MRFIIGLLAFIGAMAFIEWIAQFEIIGWLAIAGIFAGLIYAMWKIARSL